LQKKNDWKDDKRQQLLVKRTPCTVKAMRLAHPDILPFSVQQLENDFSDALRVRQRAQRGVERAIYDTSVL